MSIPVTSNASRSRLYVSSAIESTAGVAATLNKSFYIKPGSGPHIKEDADVDDEVTGYDGPLGVTRTRIRTAGNIAVSLTPDAVAWALKFMHGAAPTSALVSPSSTVYEHTFNSWATAVATFTCQKKMANISTYLEKFAGTAIKTMTVKSSGKKVELELELIGMGIHTMGDAEGSATPSTERYLVGANTNVKIDGTAANQGVLLTDWSLTIDPGIEEVDGGGVEDLTTPLIDRENLRMITAQCTLLAENRTRLDDFVNETTRSWEFILTGPTIDSPNSLKSLVAFKIEKGRTIGDFPTKLAHGKFQQKINIQALIDTATGRDMTNRVRNLTASY